MRFPSCLALAFFVPGCLAASFAHAEPSRHHVEVATSSLFLVTSCACDGYGLLDDPFASGARVGYRFHPLPWLGVGIAPALRFHDGARSIFVPLTLAPTWSLGRESAVWLLAGGGFAHLSGELPGGRPTGSSFRQNGLFGQAGAGGAITLTPRLSLFGELLALAGRGTVAADDAYPGMYIDGQRGTYVGAGLDLGVRWGL